MNEVREYAIAIGIYIGEGVCELEQAEDWYKKLYEVRVDTAFREVMQACAEPRKNEAGTWIDNDMLQAYCQLHELGYAHSIECWRDNELVGGLYGIEIGYVFFGESMFSKQTDASKVALEYLCNTRNPKLIDVQIYSEHMESLGAELINRDEFIEMVNSYCRKALGPLSSQKN